MWALWDATLATDDLERVDVKVGESPIPALEAAMITAAERGVCSFGMIDENGYLDWKTLKRAEGLRQPEPVAELTEEEIPL